MQRLAHTAFGRGFSACCGLLLACSGTARPSNTQAPAAASARRAPTSSVAVEGRSLLVDGQPYVIRGVCWNPVGVGGQHPEDLDYAGFAEADIALMAALGINTVRTYEPLLNIEVLDQLFAAGIRVINTVYPWGGSPPSVVTERVLAVKGHPAILFWALGNEWNYNGLYFGLSQARALAAIQAAAELVKAADSTHPISTIYGELPTPETLSALPGIDIWGINSYRGISFGNLFEQWEQRSQLPMYVAEYGADAYNALTSRYDPESHTQAVVSLTEELLARAAGPASDPTVLGGTLFEFADEWWKDPAGSPDSQEVGGIAPGGGPFPDQTFNEEWWGLVEIDRTPRPAYAALKNVFDAH